jgi:integrase
MYLWKRHNGFTYQQRVPVNVESKIGKSPIRVNLGPLSAAEAKKRAIILSGAAIQMMDEPGMTRETLVHSLRALNDELKAIRSAKFASGVASYGVQSQGKEYRDMGADELADEEDRKLVQISAERKVLIGFQRRLENIAEGLTKDAVAWEAERGTYQSVVALLGSLDRQNTISVNQSPPVAVERPLRPPMPFPAAPIAKADKNDAPVSNAKLSDPRAFTAQTMFSVAGRVILDARRAALDSTDEDRSRYEERLDATFAAFLEVIGDHRLEYYLPLHLQDFATLMGKVPKNRTKYPMFKGLTLKEVVAKNESLPEGQRIQRLSRTTVKEHVTQIKLIWEKATSSVRDVRDIRSFNVTMPSAAVAPIDREGLPPESLNKWLADMVKPSVMRKPHKAWLPLVGYLTGMRLTEIVYLQSSDIVTIEGNEVIDLRQPLIVDGKSIDRQLKTRTSVRVVAIHPLLRDCGFIGFAKKQRGRGGFVFPHFHTARDPADAAQKQMANWMISLGIHETQRQVFHSLRHNAKAWFRIHAGDGLADKQCGHAASSVGARYGFKVLEPEEVERIMAIPAPRSVDFSPLINWFEAQ